MKVGDTITVINPHSTMLGKVGKIVRAWPPKGSEPTSYLVGVQFGPMSLAFGTHELAKTEAT